MVAGAIRYFLFLIRSRYDSDNNHLQTSHVCVSRVGTMASQDTTVAAKSPLKGSCLCRAIQYEVTGDPTRRALCHCENCSKASGSSFMANWWFGKDVSCMSFASTEEHEIALTINH
jgi:hypothetical protein